MVAHFHYVCGVRYPLIRWYWKALYWGPRVLILVPTENFCPRMSNAHHQSISGGGRSSGTRKQNLWCVGERISSMVACFETGGPRRLTCYCRVCMSKPNAYGERGTSEAESDSKSRSLQTCKHLEGTPEGSDSHWQQMSHDSAAGPRSVERVEGNYHEEPRLGPAPAKGRKTFKAKCALHTAGFAGPCTSRPTFASPPRRQIPRFASVHQGWLTQVQRTAFHVVGCFCVQAQGCAAGSAADSPGGRGSHLVARTTPSVLRTELCKHPAGWVEVLRSIHSSGCGRPDPRVGSTSEQEAQRDVNGSHIMTLSPPQFKVASVSSTRYGLTKLAELKRHRDGKYRHIIEILADPLVLLAAYGHLKIKYRTGATDPGEFGATRSHGGSTMGCSRVSERATCGLQVALCATPCAQWSLRDHPGGIVAKGANHKGVSTRWRGFSLGNWCAAPGCYADSAYGRGTSHLSPRTACRAAIIERGPLDSIDREWFDFAAKRLIEGNYECKPARRVVIPKQGVSTRSEAKGRYSGSSERIPISVVSHRDQIVQEVVRIVLSYIYDGGANRSFSASASCRQSSGVHSALRDIRRKWNGVSWFIEFNIRKRDDTISRRILVNILREDIQDQRFFNLIHKMFNTKTVNLLPSNQVPQGSILSPLLCDLYLSKLDQEVKRIQVEYNSSQRKRRENPVFHNFTRVTLDEKKQLEFNRYKIRRLLLKRIRRAYQKGISKTDYNDPNFVRIFYVRYADDLLFGVIGSKILVKKVQNRVSQFLKSSLQLEVSKTTIIHSTAGMVNFLGIQVACDLPPKYCALRRSSESRLRISLRLQTKSLLRKKAWEASIRRIAFQKWADAFEKTCKLLGSTTLAKRAAFSNAFELAQRLTTNQELRHKLDELFVSQLLKGSRPKAASSTILNGLPKEIKRKHVELISLLDDHFCNIGLKFCNRLNKAQPQLSATRSGSTSMYSPKSRPPRLLAPLDHIRDQLRRRGIVEDQNFRPTALKRMLNHEDFSIVNYFRAIAHGLLSYYRCCDNFHKVKRIATYQIRWSAIFTLANKHKLTAKKVINRYTMDLIIKQEVNGQAIIVAKFPSKKEIAIMSRKFLVNAQIPRYSSPLRP